MRKVTMPPLSRDPEVAAREVTARAHYAELMGSDWPETFVLAIREWSVQPQACAGALEMSLLTEELVVVWAAGVLAFLSRRVAEVPEFAGAVNNAWAAYQRVASASQQERNDAVARALDEPGELETDRRRHFFGLIQHVWPQPFSKAFRNCLLEADTGVGETELRQLEYKDSLLWVQGLVAYLARRSVWDPGFDNRVAAAREAFDGAGQTEAEREAAVAEAMFGQPSGS
jgi:hypothetical protein